MRVGLRSLTDGEGEPHTVLFICLNPSTADETENDPTVTRCIGYARRWRFERLVVCNLFAFRATDPRDMKAAVDPVGPDNDAWLERVAGEALMIVAGWGSHGTYRDRSDHVRGLLHGWPLYCLGVTANGQPRHPLYMRADTEPVVWA